MRSIYLFILFIWSTTVFGKPIVDFCSNFPVPSVLACSETQYHLRRMNPEDYLRNRRNIHLAKRIIFYNYGYAEGVIEKLPKVKCVLFLWEPWIPKYQMYNLYGRVYTWDDSLVDNVKFFKFYYPSLQPFYEDPVPFVD